MNKKLSFYVLVLLVFGLGIYLVLQAGRKLQPPLAAVSPDATEVGAVSAPGVGPTPSLFANLRENLRDPLGRLFIQLILVVLVARLCGSLATRLGQPAVIGEMVAGILLGPSLLGWVWPEVFRFIFPGPSLGTLRLLSQIGICLFMFVVGMELELDQLRHHAHTAVAVSQISILFPYFLGVVISLGLFPTLAAPHTTFLAFALFIGISMSITAFPVLARILDERGLTKTALGTTAIACAAVGDATAWSVLAFVVAIVKAGGLAAAALSIGMVLFFVTAMLLWVRPRVPGWIGHTPRDGGVPGKGVMGGVLVFLLASALATDVMGIHALFGAFLAGVVMPAHGEFRDFLKVRIEHFSSVFLLPLFFAFTGLRTQINLLNDTSGLLVCLGLIFIATLGKLGGTLVTARLSGINWIDSFALGALMNTRGLIELIALNIGYDLGILSPRMFAMLVVMALVTTCLAGPSLTLADYFRRRQALAIRPV
ncbi:MAG: cation:proton antiporter domain-containing protein [Limisphaerales bacterium]